MRKSEVRKKHGIWLYATLFVLFVFVFVYGRYWMKINVPSKIKLLVGEEETFDFAFPMQASISEDDSASVLYVNQEPLKQLSAVSPSVTAEAVPSFSSEKGMGKRKSGGYRTLSCISFLIQTASANAIY